MKECPACQRCYHDRVNYCLVDGSATTLSIEGEPVLDDCYLLERRIGRGSTGTVYEARHRFLKTRHAVKLIRPDLISDHATLVARFRQEALGAASLRHQNIIAVTDFGVARGTMPFLVMEFVQGKSLHDILVAEGALPPSRALEIMAAIGSGVAAAHRQNIVHRDLKPLNIMLMDGLPVAEAVKILDFGLVRIKEPPRLSPNFSTPGAALETCALYMAPEQWQSEDADARADIYSLGVILYQMLGGDVPFKGTNTPLVMWKHLMDPPPPLSALGVSVPPGVEAVVRRALEKDPKARPQSAKEFIVELQNAFEPTSHGELATVAQRNEPSLTPDISRPLSMEGEPARARQLDENVQFTVYRPRAVEPEKLYWLLAYAHLSERRPDAPADSPHPKEEVERKAREILGDKFQGYLDAITDSRQAIPQEGVLTFMPVFEGIEFVPKEHTLLWEGPAHELRFRIRARRELEGQTARGYLRVYLGAILVAEVSIAIPVDTQKARQYGEASAELESSAALYRKIFASYSHADEAIVRQFEQLVEAFGDEYLRDVRDIRAGEEWNERLEELIREADIFQLFWSKNSMRSEFVRDEWKYALSLDKRNFIRPTFWEEPMPEDRSAGLPPEDLLKLQFKRVPVRAEEPRPGRTAPSPAASKAGGETVTSKGDLFCNNCGAKAKAMDSFCRKCGHRIGQDMGATIVSPRAQSPAQRSQETNNYDEYPSLSGSPTYSTRSKESLPLGEEQHQTGSLVPSTTQYAPATGSPPPYNQRHSTEASATRDQGYYQGKRRDDTFVNGAQESASGPFDYPERGGTASVETDKAGASGLFRVFLILMLILLSLILIGFIVWPLLR